MYNLDSSPTITNCTFCANSATGSSGGAIFNYTSYAMIANCVFSDNSPANGGAVGNYGASSGITNCTFVGNSATTGGAVYNFTDSSLTVRNSVLWGDSASSAGGEFYNADSVSVPIITYSIVQGLNLGTGNFSSDPQLNSDFSLRATSPAIDAGDCASNLDILGNPRWDIASVANATGSNGVDIGAYEYQGNWNRPWAAAAG